MKKILVPVDFSGHTEMTLNYALELAGKGPAEIHFFHTYFDQIILADTGFPDTLDMTTVYNEELMKEIFKGAETAMKELVIRVEAMITSRQLDNITISSTVVGGEIEHELKMICHDYKPDMVVMGTRGKGNNLNVWGKVSTYVIDHARVPVFTIPKTEMFGGFANIMFTADLSEKNLQTLRQLNLLFEPYRSVIHVVHFLVPSKKRDEDGRMEALQNNFKEQHEQGLMQFHLLEVEDENNQTAIDQFIRQYGINLIAFQPHKRSLFYMVFTRHITKKNLFATNIPLLAIPAGE